MSFAGSSANYNRGNEIDTVLRAELERLREDAETLRYLRVRHQRIVAAVSAMTCQCRGDDRLCTRCRILEREAQNVYPEDLPKKGNVRE